MEKKKGNSWKISPFGHLAVEQNEMRFDFFTFCHLTTQSSNIKLAKWEINLVKLLAWSTKQTFSGHIEPMMSVTFTCLRDSSGLRSNFVTQRNQVATWVSVMGTLFIISTFFI